MKKIKIGKNMKEVRIMRWRLHKKIWEKKYI